jgi:hypothetical protein
VCLASARCSSSILASIPVHIKKQLVCLKAKLDAFIPSSRQLEVISHNNLGASELRLSGIQEVDGSFVWWINSDTWEPRGIVWNVLAYLLTMSFTALAVFSKEHGITLPVRAITLKSHGVTLHNHLLIRANKFLELTSRRLHVSL